MNITPRILSTTLTVLLLAVALSESSPVLVAAMSPARASTTSSPQLVINGVSHGNIVSAEGGHPIAEIITQQGNSAPTKRVGNLRYAPIRLVLALPLDANLQSLVNAFLSGAQQPVSLTVAQAGNSTTGRLDATDALLSEVQFTSFDGASKNPATLTLVFRPSQVIYGKSDALPTSPPFSGKQKAALQNNFALSIGTLPCARIASIEAFSVTRSQLANSVGNGREASNTLGELMYGNLVFSISIADAAAWLAWEKTFLIQGQHLDSNELSGTLSLLGPDLKSTLMGLQFSHVGLVSLERPKMSRPESETLPRLRAELYVQGVTLTGAGAPPANQPASTTSDNANGTTAATQSGTTEAPAEGTAEPTPVDTVTDTSSGTGTATGTGASTGTTTGTLAGKDTPLGARTPVSKGGRTTSRTLTALTTDSAEPLVAVQHTDPQDQGAREPADFPRIAGLRRVSYTSYAAESKLEESANYETKLSIAEVATGYEQALKEAGWTQTYKSESGSATDHSLYKHLKWTKTVQGAELRLSQTKEGGTTIELATDATRAGILSAITASLKGIDPGAAAEASPADQGTKDPADFPRMAKSVRRSYRNSGTATAPFEVVVYRAKLPIHQVEGFYVNHLNDAEWEQLTRRERGDPLSAEHEIIHTWTRGARNVKVTLLEVEPAITQISLELSVSAP